MTEKDFIKQLKRLQSVKPRAEWTERNRSLLLSSIRQGENKDMPAFESGNVPIIQQVANLSSWFSVLIPTKNTFLMLRPAGAFFAVTILLLSSGIITVSAAQNSIPGDSLYAVKIMSEKVQKALTTDEKEKARLEIVLAGKRLDELKIIMDQPSTQEKNEQVAIVLSKFEENISSAQKTLDVLNNGKSHSEAVSLAEVIDRKVSEYKEALDKTAVAASDEVKVNIKSAAGVAEKNSEAALTIILEKHDAGEVVGTAEEIQTKVDKKRAMTTMLLAEVQAEINALLSDTSSASFFADINLEDKSTTTKKLISAQSQLDIAKGVLLEADGLIINNKFTESLAKITESKDLALKVQDKIEEIEDLIRTEPVIVEGITEEKIENATSSSE